MPLPFVELRLHASKTFGESCTDLEPYKVVSRVTIPQILVLGSDHAILVGVDVIEGHFRQSRQDLWETADLVERTRVFRVF